MTKENFGMYCIWDEEMEAVIEMLSMVHLVPPEMKEAVDNVRDRLSDAREELVGNGRIKSEAPKFEIKEYITARAISPEHWEFEIVEESETPEDDESIVRAVIVETQDGRKEMHIYADGTAAFVGRNMPGQAWYYEIKNIEERKVYG